MTPPPDVRLTDMSVHIWRADLDQSPTMTEAFRAILTADERARADRFRFAHDRARFIVARGVLRVLLGGYLHVDPADIAFRYNQYGKPAIERPDAGTSLRLNLSHSVDVALYACALGREVGIDIEAVRTNLPLLEIAESTFSPAEYTALRRLAPSAQPRGFFNCWTRKEAYIKARGMGLSLPLDQFDVSLAPGEPAALLRTAGKPEAVHQWSLRDIAIGSGFAAAIAAEGQDWQVSYWHFDGERWFRGRAGA